MILQKGDIAPDFTLLNTEKKEVKLADYRGKNLIIHFFPLAFSGVCTKQLCTVRDAITMYKNERADVLAISNDSLFVLGKFKEDQNLQFELLSDYNKEVSAAYGALYETFPAFGMKGVAKRAVFVLDKDGVIKHMEVLPSPGDFPNFDAIDATLAELI